MNRNLLRFAIETREMEDRMREFSEHPVSNLLELELFHVGHAEKAVKGLLVMNNRITDVSEDVTKILFSVASCSYGEEKEWDYPLNIVLRGIGKGEKDLETLYKFYEACRFSDIVFEISYALSGNGTNTPLMEACYMANPKMFEKLFTGPKWEFDYEQTVMFAVIKIFSENSKGKVIHKKLNDLLIHKYWEAKNDSTVK